MREPALAAQQHYQRRHNIDQLGKCYTRGRGSLDKIGKILKYFVQKIDAEKTRWHWKNSAKVHPNHHILESLSIALLHLDSLVFLHKDGDSLVFLHKDGDSLVPPASWCQS